MKIDKNSWHFKLLDYFDCNITYKLSRGYNVTLCQYFWNVVGALIRGFALGFAFLFIGLFSCAAIWAVILMPINYLFISYFGVEVFEDNGYFGLGMLVVFWMVIPTIVGCGDYVDGRMKLFPKWMKLSSVNTKPRAEKKPSLIVEYLKAKKSKICPLIELEK